MEHNLQDYKSRYLSEVADGSQVPHCINYKRALWEALEQCKQISGDNITRILNRAARLEINKIKKRAELLAKRGIFEIKGYRYGREGRKISS